MEAKVGTRLIGLGAAAVVLAAALALPADAAAGARHERRWAKPRPHPQAIAVPRTIRVKHARQYAPFYQGQAYYAPHHHAHALYYFPARVGPRIVYRPHYYCGDTLFLGAHLHAPRLELRIDF